MNTELYLVIWNVFSLWLRKFLKVRQNVESGKAQTEIAGIMQFRRHPL
jgi:hypothetical protein